MQDHDTTNETANAASSQFILVELRGGAHHGQTVRVPHDEFHLVFEHEGKRFTYQRFNDAPVFRHEDAIVQLLGGGR